VVLARRQEKESGRLDAARRDDELAGRLSVFGPVRCRVDGRLDASVGVGNEALDRRAVDNACPSGFRVLDMDAGIILRAGGTDRLAGPVADAWPSPIVRF